MRANTNTTIVSSTVPQPIASAATATATFVACVVLCSATAEAAPPELTYTGDIRTSTTEVTSVCEGTTSDSTTAPGGDPFLPFETLDQTEQECATGDTSGSAFSLLQSQLYPTGVYHRGVVYTEGASTLGIEANASNLVDIEFTVAETVRFTGYGQLRAFGGLVGGTLTEVNIDGGGQSLLSESLLGDTSFQVLDFVSEGLIDAGTYTLVASAEATQTTPVTALPGGETEVDLFFWITRLGDADQDGTVDFADLLDVLGAWGTCPADLPCIADVNADGVVNFADVLMVIGNWGA